jgi:hypothetical protein
VPVAAADGRGEIDVSGWSVSAAWLECDAPAELVRDRGDAELRARMGEAGGARVSAKVAQNDAPPVLAQC